jgi:hypothetical protein
MQQTRRCRVKSAPAHGFGVSKAGCDAQALANALRDHDDVDRTGGIQSRPPTGRRGHREAPPILQSPRVMMDWIAVPNFLDAYR